MGPGRTDFEILLDPPQQGGGSDGLDDDGSWKMCQNRTDFEISPDLPQQGGGSNGLDDGGRLKRTGAVWTAGARMITDVIRPEILSLPWAVAQLGWIVGPGVMFLFSFVTCYTFNLLAACYRLENTVIGERNSTYRNADRSVLGVTKAKLCVLVLSLNLLGVAIGCTIASVSMMMAIGESNYVHEKGDNSPYHKSSNPYIIAFGVIEIVLSQILNLDQLWWFLTLYAVTSFTYLTGGLVLSIVKVTENRNFSGNLIAISTGSVARAQRMWRSFKALGDIAFASSYPIEILETSKSPPSDAKTIKKATLVREAVKNLICILCGCMGYAAFGDKTPRNLLMAFGFFNPYWPINIVNTAMAIHLICAYQVCSRPIFGFTEDYVQKRFESSLFITKEIEIPVPGFPAYKLNAFQLIWRTIYVILTTGISMLLPFFNDVVRLLGALGFWPLMVHFPVEMYIVQMEIPKWSTKWLCLQILSVACLIVTVAAAMGSITGVVLDLKSYKAFSSTIP